MSSEPSLRYDRLYRTPSSEAYLVSVADLPLGRLDLHYAQGVVFGLLVLDEEPSAEVIHALTAQIDDELVWTAGVARQDFVLTVYVGRELLTLDDDTREHVESTANGDN